MAKVRVEGMTLIVGRTRVSLRFLRTHTDHGDGSGDGVPRVKVRCYGCGREKAVPRVGLRVVAGNVIDLQPNCIDCRAIMKARKKERVG